MGVLKRWAHTVKYGVFVGMILLYAGHKTESLEWLLVQGYHGIDHEVFLSLPVVVGENGINAVFNQRLADDEVEKIKKSAETLHDMITQLSL